LSEESAVALYHYAEIARIYKCPGISTKIDDYLTSFDVKSQTDATELYYGYLLNSNAKDY
jgi:hypothetical protein